MNTLIKNAAVVFCDGVRVSDILIENGKIADTDYKGEITENMKILNADGNYLLAGFVDLHVHGGGGADFKSAAPGLQGGVRWPLRRKEAGGHPCGYPFRCGFCADL